MMTLGMVEIVKLAHRRECLTFLQKEKYPNVLQQQTGKRSAEKVKESRLSEHHEKAVHKLPVCGSLSCCERSNGFYAASSAYF